MRDCLINVGPRSTSPWIRERSVARFQTSQSLTSIAAPTLVRISRIQKIGKAAITTFSYYNDRRYCCDRLGTLLCIDP